MENRESDKEISSPYAWQLLEVNFSNGMSLKAATWNIHNQYHADITNSRIKYNNPFHVIEKLADYEIRKRKQLQQLERFMQQHLDVIFLQEPDWVVVDMTATKQFLYVEFKQSIEKHQWTMIRSPTKNHMNLVTLINQKTLTYSYEQLPQGCFWNYQLNQFCGLRIDVKRKGFSQPLALINIHFTSPPSQYDNILSYQENCIQKNLACIIGGQVAYDKPPSLFSVNDHTSLYRSSEGFVTCRPPKRGSIFHGFFVNPYLNGQVSLCDLGSMDFDEDIQGSIIYDTQARQITHHSQISMPWQSDWDLYQMSQNNLKTANRLNFERWFSLSRDLFDKLIQEPFYIPSVFCLQLVENYYKYALFNRYHLFKAAYQGKQGDQAKRKILDQLLEKLKNIYSSEELKQFEKEFKTQDNYKILITSQGLFSRIFNLQTDSYQAVTQMFDIKQKTLKTI